MRVTHGREPKPIIVTLDKPENVKLIRNNKAKLKNSTVYQDLYKEHDKSKQERLTFNHMPLVAKHSQGLEFQKGRLYEKKQDSSSG